MPRPRIDPQQEIYVYQLYVDSGRTLSARAMVQALEGRFGPQEAARQRTVERWLAGWKTKPIEADVSFEWHRMEEYGLPREAGAYLVRMRVFVLEGKDRFYIEGPPRRRRKPVFSFRLAKWCWWVHQAAPDLCMFDVSWLANSCSFRELACDLTGHPFDLDDIMDYLGFRPWVGLDRHARYMRVVETGNDERPSAIHPLDRDFDLTPEGASELVEAVEEWSNAMAGPLRNPALDLEPVQRARRELSVGYWDDPSFKSDGRLQSDWLASTLFRSDPYELETLVGWLPPGYLQDREEFGALSDESLHEHIRRASHALEAGTARRR